MQTLTLPRQLQLFADEFARPLVYGIVGNGYPNKPQVFEYILSAVPPGSRVLRSPTLDPAHPDAAANEEEVYDKADIILCLGSKSHRRTDKPCIRITEG